MSSIHDPRYRNLIKALIQTRELKKITQVQLSSSLKKQQSYVAKVENFERRLDVLELHDWLHVLEISISNFLDENL